MATDVLELQEIELYQIFESEAWYVSGHVLVSDWMWLNKTSLGIQNHGSAPPPRN